MLEPDKKRSAMDAEKGNQDTKRKQTGGHARMVKTASQRRHGPSSTTAREKTPHFQRWMGELRQASAKGENHKMHKQQEILRRPQRFLGTHDESGKGRDGFRHSRKKHFSKKGGGGKPKDHPQKEKEDCNKKVANGTPVGTTRQGLRVRC